MRHDVLHSPRLQELKKHRRRNFQNKIILIVVGFLVLFFGFGFLSRISKLNIKDVVVSGNIVVDTEDIIKVAQTEMTGHYFWLFPKTNIFFYPKNKIKNNLETQFRRLKDISISLGSNENIEITLAEREGVYMWCGVDLPEIPEQEKCSFLDKDGHIFDEAPYFSGEVYFKFYGSIFEVYNPIFSKLITFKENLEQMELKPVALLAREGEDLKILLSGNTHPEIIFKIDTDLQKSTENLQAALDTEPLKTDIKKKYSSLLYIDLRYGNKVYYKFK